MSETSAPILRLVASRETTALQPVSAFRPTLADGLLVGDGVDDWLQVRLPAPLAQPYTLVVRGRLVGNAGAYLLDGLADGARLAITRISATVAEVNAGKALRFPLDDQIHTITVRADGPQSAVCVDGEPVEFGDLGSQPLSGLTLFARLNGQSRSASSLADVRAYPGAISPEAIRATAAELAPPPTVRAYLFASPECKAAAMDFAVAVMPGGDAERQMFSRPCGVGQWVGCSVELTESQLEEWIAFRDAHLREFWFYLGDGSWGWTESLSDLRYLERTRGGLPDRWASPAGRDGAAGTEADPLSLTRALTDPTLYAPTATLHLLPGVYRGSYTVRVSGLTIKPAGSLWSALVDGLLAGPADVPDVTVRGVASGYTGWTTRRGQIPGSSPPSPKSGIELAGPRGRISLCLTGDASGLAAWGDGSVVSDNVVLNIGWNGPDRGHGHGLYFHGKGVRVSGNLFAQCYSSYSVHGYTQDSGELYGAIVEDNACHGIVLLGGSAPVRWCQVDRNVSRDRLWLGHANSPESGQSARVRDNVVAGTLVRGGWDAGNPEIDGTIPFGSIDRVDVIPSRDNPGVALVLIHNASLAPTVPVDLTGYGPGRLVWWMDPSRTLAFTPGVVEVPTAGWGVATPLAAEGPLAESTAPGFLAFLVVPDES